MAAAPANTAGVPAAAGAGAAGIAPVGGEAGGVAAASGAPAGTAGAAGVAGAAGAAPAAGAGGEAGALAGASGEAGAAGAAGTPATEAGAPPPMLSCDKDLTPMPGQDECSAPLKPNDDRLCMRTIGGQARQFYVYASPAFDPCQPATMIMDFHGLSENIEQHTGKTGFSFSGGQYAAGYGSGWRMAVQQDNAVVVTPAGINMSWNALTDVAFANEVADFVETIADIDPEREYVTGISMGGMMTVATGCGDATRWRAMAPVAMLQQACPAISRPMPVISFHAVGDLLTSYASDQALMQTIAGLNHCTTGPTPSATYGGPNTSSEPVCYVTPNGVGDPDAPDPYHVPLQPCPSTAPVSQCVTWSGCDEGVEVTFCTVDNAGAPLGGHILYSNTTQLNLAEVAWRFFKKFW